MAAFPASPVACCKNNKRTYKTGNSLFLAWLMSLFAHIFTTRNFKKIRDQIKH